MVQGKEEEYVLRIINRGDRAAPVLPAIPMTPKAVALEHKTKCGNNYMRMHIWNL